LKLQVQLFCGEPQKAPFERLFGWVSCARTHGLEYLKIEMRLIDERFGSVMGECVLEAIGTPSIFSDP
jgi:hypothetical protein